MDVFVRIKDVLTDDYQKLSEHDKIDYIQAVFSILEIEMQSIEERLSQRKLMLMKEKIDVRKQQHIN